jgi:N-acyl-L-homoserine lactone synthetase
MSRPLLPITWRLRLPPGGDPIAARWLAELSEMRGRVLYHVCGLPDFRLADGSFADPDPIDQRACHLLATSPDGVVGCVRAFPLAGPGGSVAESLLGRRAFEQLLLSIGATREHTVEVSRWFVLPEYACGSIGTRLIAGMWAVLRWLGTRKAIGMAGTRDGQDRLLLSMGGRRAPGLAPIVSPRFGQTIVALWFDIPHPSKRWEALVNKMAVTLKLDDRLERLPALGGAYEARSRPFAGPPAQLNRGSRLGVPKNKNCGYFAFL